MPKMDMCWFNTPDKLLVGLFYSAATRRQDLVPADMTTAGCFALLRDPLTACSCISFFPSHRAKLN